MVCNLSEYMYICSTFFQNVGCIAEDYTTFRNFDSPPKSKNTKYDKVLEQDQT